MICCISESKYNTTTFCIQTGLAEVRKYGGELQRILAPRRHTCTPKNFAECTLHLCAHLNKTLCPPAPANFLCALNFHWLFDYFDDVNSTVCFLIARYHEKSVSQKTCKVAITICTPEKVPHTSTLHAFFRSLCARTCANVHTHVLVSTHGSNWQCICSPPVPPILYLM